MDNVQETPIMTLCHAVHHACADMEYALKKAAIAHGAGERQYAIARVLEIYHATNSIDGAVKAFCRAIGSEKGAQVRIDKSEALGNL